MLCNLDASILVVKGVRVPTNRVDTLSTKRHHCLLKSVVNWQLEETPTYEKGVVGDWRSSHKKRKFDKFFHLHAVPQEKECASQIQGTYAVYLKYKLLSGTGYRYGVVIPALSILEVVETQWLEVHSKYS